MKDTRHDHTIDLLVLQPSGFCNIDCTYCYLPDRANKARMSEEVLERTIQQVLESRWLGQALTVVWHAGEPLAVPMSFYEKAMELFARHNTRGIEITQSFQTNGTLLSAEWCQFLKRHDFKIGVSIDGPAWIHDRQRVTRAKKGTHASVMSGVRLLREHGIRFSAIGVLTHDSLDHADAIFDFFHTEGFSGVGFNIEEVEGTHAVSSLAGAEAVERVRAFHRRILERAASDGRLRIREFDLMSPFLLFGEGMSERGQENTPMSIVSVDLRGNVSTFSPELLTMKSDRFGDFTFGNVLTDRIDDIPRNPRFRAVYREIRQGMRACKSSCAYFGVCGGGAPSNKLGEHGRFDASETMHCRLTRKVLTDCLLESLETVVGLRRDDAA